MNPAIRDWRNQRVWVIGASSGIGEAVAQHLMMLGARVAVSARNAEALARVVSISTQAVACPLDVTDHASVTRAAHQLDAMWGGFDLVIICAGGYTPMRADGFDLDAAKALVGQNLIGVLHCLDAVLPALLREQAGAIAVVSSVAGFRGLPKALVYGPTKAALINLCESLYLDLRPRGIDVHLVTPGFVDTPMTAQNDFAMPALLSVDEAADALILGIERGQFHVHFPRRFTLLMRLLRLLPYRLYFWLVQKVTAP